MCLRGWVEMWSDDIRLTGLLRPDSDEAKRTKHMVGVRYLRRMRCRLIFSPVDWRAGIDIPPVVFSYTKPFKSLLELPLRRTDSEQKHSFAMLFLILTYDFCRSFSANQCD